MNTVFYVICILMMTLMIFGVIIYYLGMVSTRSVENTILLGCIAVLEGIILWLLFGCLLSSDFKWMSVSSLSTDMVLKGIVEMYFFLYAVTMLFGSILERGNWRHLLLYIPVWLVVVYAPLANFFWGASGMFSEIHKHVPSFDYSGGLVVHASAGIGSLILTLKLPVRKKKSSSQPWQAATMLMGTLLIIVGWFCFNMAPAGAAGDEAISVLVNTLTALAVAGLTGFFVQRTIDSSWSYQAILNGMITGLVGSTTGVGYVSIGASAMIAFLVSGTCPLIIHWLHQKFTFDDAVDSFGMNAIGGILGSLFAGIFAFNGNYVWSQVIVTFIVIIWSLVGAFLIHQVTRRIIPDVDADLESEM